MMRTMRCFESTLTSHDPWLGVMYTGWAAMGPQSNSGESNIYLETKARVELALKRIFFKKYSSEKERHLQNSKREK